jgi:hypothetical protein
VNVVEQMSRVITQTIVLLFQRGITGGLGMVRKGVLFFLFGIRFFTCLCFERV